MFFILNKKNIYSDEEVPPMFLYIVNIIGYENTVKLFEEFGGNAIYFPSLKKVNIQIRNNSIKDKFFKGSTVKNLSKEFNLSDTQVRNILKK